MKRKSNNNRKYKRKTKTRRNRRTRTYRRRMIAGATTTTNPLEKTKSNRMAGVFNKITTIVSNILGRMLTAIGKLIGVDFTNKSQVDSNLQVIENNLKDPGIKAKIYSITQKALSSLSIVFQAMEPYILPFMEKMISIGTTATEKVINAGINIGLNTLEAIPGPSIFVGLARDISSVMDSIFAVSNAVSQTVSTSADTFAGFMKNIASLKNKISNQSPTPTSSTPVESTPETSL